MIATRYSRRVDDSRCRRSQCHRSHRSCTCRRRGLDDLECCNANIIPVDGHILCTRTRQAIELHIVSNRRRTRVHRGGLRKRSKRVRRLQVVHRASSGHGRSICAAISPPRRRDVNNQVVRLGRIKPRDRQLLRPAGLIKAGAQHQVLIRQTGRCVPDGRREVVVVRPVVARKARITEADCRSRALRVNQRSFCNRTCTSIGIRYIPVAYRKHTSRVIATAAVTHRLHHTVIVILRELHADHSAG